MDDASQSEATKAYQRGTHRIRSPAETLARLLPIKKRFGITRLANVTGLDRIGIPVVVCMRPNSRSVAVSQGKGLDLDSAKASALMESIETWHGERIDAPLIYGPYEDLKARHALADPAILPQVPGPGFSDRARCLWIEARNLTDDRSRWLPYEMVHCDYSHPRPAGEGYFHCSTNGLASGNHPLEAINHGLCEVIERDATTLWHLSPRPRRDARRLDLDSVEDRDCRMLIDRFAEAGLGLAVWDTTTDLGVAAFHAFLIDQNDSEAHLGAGAGCHPDPVVALSRTLTEAAQTRLTYVSGARDDLLPGEFTPEGLARKRASALAYLTTDNCPRRFDAVPAFRGATLEADHAWLLERLASRGYPEVLAVDLSQADLDVAVFRVVIPGLEAPHDDSSYLPGARAAAFLDGVKGDNG